MCSPRAPRPHASVRDFPRKATSNTFPGVSVQVFWGEVDLGDISEQHPWICSPKGVGIWAIGGMEEASSGIRCRDDDYAPV